MCNLIRIAVEIFLRNFKVFKGCFNSCDTYWIINNKKRLNKENYAIIFSVKPMQIKGEYHEQYI